MFAEKSRTAALFGGRTKPAILEALLACSESLNISELARRAHLGKTTASQAIPSLEKAGLVRVTKGARDHQVMLVTEQRKVVEQILGLDAPVLPVPHEEMTDEEWAEVARFFAAPSTVQARTDDWDDSQRVMPVTRAAWEGRRDLD